VTSGNGDAGVPDAPDGPPDVPHQWRGWRSDWRLRGQWRCHSARRPLSLGRMFPSGGAGGGNDRRHGQQRAMPGCQTPLMFPSGGTGGGVVRRLAVQPLVDQWQLVGTHGYRWNPDNRRNNGDAAARPVLQGTYCDRRNDSGAAGWTSAGGATTGSGGAAGAAGGTAGTSTTPGWGTPVSGGPTGTGVAATVTVDPSTTGGDDRSRFCRVSSYEKTHITKWFTCQHQHESDCAPQAPRFSDDAARGQRCRGLQLGWAPGRHLRSHRGPPIHGIRSTRDG